MKLVAVVKVHESSLRLSSCWKTNKYNDYRTCMKQAAGERAVELSRGDGLFLGANIVDGVNECGRSTAMLWRVYQHLTSTKSSQRVF